MARTCQVHEYYTLVFTQLQQDWSNWFIRTFGQAPQVALMTYKDSTGQEGAGSELVAEAYVRKLVKDKKAKYLWHTSGNGPTEHAPL